jgi:anthranilate/para-aminobenzoate synthase component I
MSEFLVTREIDRDALPADPALWCHAFRDRPGTVLLDSALKHDRLGRWSFLAIDPVHLVRSKAGRTWIDDNEVDRDPFAVLKSLIDRYRIPDEPDLPPFATGIAGYLVMTAGTWRTCRSIGRTRWQCRTCSWGFLILFLPSIMRGTGPC